MKNQDHLKARSVLSCDYRLMQSLAEEGLKFVERCAASDAAAAANDFLAVIGQAGFAGAACGGWAGIGRHRKHRFFFVNWPQDWREFYEKHGFVEHDLLTIESRRRVSPFWYGSIKNQFKLSEKQKELDQAAWAYGWRDVFAVPIHGPGSLQGLVTMATRQAPALSAGDSAVVEIMARTVWGRCGTAESFGAFDPKRTRLSARELECLQWAAAGKSDTDIAVLVGVKPATAHFHIEQAKKRLGVKTRVEAVAVGVLHGVI